MEKETGRDSEERCEKIHVKTEPPDEDMQGYAEDTMNELLAIYGYSEKVEQGVTQNMQLGTPFGQEDSEEVHRAQNKSHSKEKGRRRKRHSRHRNKEDTAGDTHCSVTPVFGSEPQSVEEDPGSPSSSQEATPEMPDSAQEETHFSDKDRIVCAWCQSPGYKHYTLNTQTESKAFCSERCFAACRRAYFKKNKVCDWCRHIRHLREYTYLTDGDQRLQFCSSKCMNQYKMDVFFRENRTIVGQGTKADSSSRSNGSSAVSPNAQQQQGSSSRTSPDTATQNANLRNSQPSPSNIPLSGVFQNHSSSSQPVMGLPQLRPSGVFGVQTVVQQPVAVQQMVPRLPVVQVVGAGGVPLNLMTGLNQQSVIGAHRSSGRLNQHQWNIPGYQSGSQFKKIRPKPLDSSATSTSTSAASSSTSSTTSTSSCTTSTSSRSSRLHHTPATISTSAANGSSILPPVTVMVPHPVFIPIPVPIPIPIPVSKEAFEAARKEACESAPQESAPPDITVQEPPPPHRMDFVPNGSSIPSSTSTGAFVPYRSHRMDTKDKLDNSTDGTTMDSALSSSLQSSLHIPPSASEALESRLRLHGHRHPSHISSSTMEAMHRSINSRLYRHKCLQRSASMDLNFGRYNTVSAITDLLGERHSFNPLTHTSPRRDVAENRGLHPRVSNTAMPSSKGAGELSPSVREALRCHLTRRLSQSALNLTDVGRYPEEDQLRRCQSLSKLREDTDDDRLEPMPEMEDIGSQNSLEKLADTSDSSDHIDSQGSGIQIKMEVEDIELQPATKRRCVESPNHVS